MYTIKYKTKVKTSSVMGEENSDFKYIDYKKTLTRKDCDLVASKHAYYNSDMFPSILNRKHKEAINNKSWCRLSELPDNVSIDTSKFLATVSIIINDDKHQ